MLQIMHALIAIRSNSATATLTAHKTAAASLLGKDDVCHASAQVLHQVGHSKEGQQLDPALSNIQLFLKLLVMRFQLHKQDTRESAHWQHVMPPLVTASGMP